MSGGHDITERLDAVQVSRLEMKSGQLVLDEVVEVQRVDGGFSQWECDCGETFGSLDRAEEHVREARTGS